jgi:serine/threonine-protein kinase RsbW
VNSDFIEMIVPSKPEYLAVVRLAVSGIANRMGYTYEEIEDIKIAITEACTNVVFHAYDAHNEGLTKINCFVHDYRLEIVVINQGKSFDKKWVHEQARPDHSKTDVENMKEGELGLLLLEALMDKVHIYGDDGVIVTMTKFIKRDEVRSDVSGVK